MESKHDRPLQSSREGNVRRKPVPRAAAAGSPLLDQAEGGQEPHGWPTSPKPIKTLVYMIVWSATVDFVLFGFSVAFFAFALIVNSYDQTSTQDHPRAKDRLVSASKYGPTIFPILFAAVVGRAAHSILVWRFEKGARIGTLDTLAESTSLTSTVISQFKLRVVSFLGVGLVTVWALSPVGGQASFRQLSIGVTTKTEPVVFDYMASTANLYGYEDSGRNSVWAVVNTLFNAAMIGPLATKRSPLDLWGNVKIPRIEYYEADHNTPPDNDGWFDVNLGKDQDPAVFVSLVGVPISGLEGAGYIDHKMRLQTTYLNLTCIKGGFDDILVPANASVVRAERGNSAMIWWKDIYSISNRTTRRSNISIEGGSLEAFTFGYDTTTGLPLRAECSLKTAYVEVEVSCSTALTCLVSKIRRSQLPHPHPNITQLDVQTGPSWNWLTFSTALVSSVTSRSAYPTLLDFYIAAPENPLLTTKDWPRLKQSAHTYTVRLGQLINTYWTCTSAPYAMTAGLTPQTSYQDPNTTFTLNDPDIAYAANYTLAAIQGLQSRLWRTSGTRNRAVEIMQAHKPWVTALCIASVILIIASTVPPVVRCFLARGPDVLMNVSSLATRDNAYVAVPGSGTFLDASERARLLRDCRVRFGDAEDGDGVGKLVIGTLDGADIVRVRKRRMYV